MSALPFVITNAGKAALVNAAHTGSAAVTIARIGLTADAFTATPLTTGLPSQVALLGTVGGEAVASDTLHVTVGDYSAASYDVRGFGLYLADGTLFGAYGQAGLIVQKSSSADLLLAVDLRFATPDAGLITFGPADFLNPPASESVQGVVQLAAEAEAIAGTDTQKVTTPRGLMVALNARFGAGAPSAFVKGLLTAASAVAFRVAIGLKGAATFDPGAGNGLDADLLDGQHGAYYADVVSRLGFTPVNKAGDSMGPLNVSALNGLYVGTPNGSNQPALPALASIKADGVMEVGPVIDFHATVGDGDYTARLSAGPGALYLNGTPLSTQAFVNAAIAALVNGSPAALDTLKELADAMGDDPNFRTTILNAIAAKVSQTDYNAQVAALVGALAGKQPNLGFTAVRQGGGPRQLGDQVNIGWDGSHIAAAIDGGDRGNILLSSDYIPYIDLAALLPSIGAQTPNGYIKLGWLIIQWGGVTFGPSGQPTASGGWTFPIAYPNACYLCIGQPLDQSNNPAGFNPICRVPATSKTGASLSLDNNSQSVPFNQSVRVTLFSIGF